MIFFHKEENTCQFYCYNLLTMQNNVPNYFSPNQNGENHSKNTLIWILIILIILGVGFLVYKKFGQKKYSFEEKIDALNSLDSGENNYSREQKEQILETLQSGQANTYTEEQKLDMLNNL